MKNVTKKANSTRIAELRVASTRIAELRAASADTKLTGLVVFHLDEDNNVTFGGAMVEGKSFTDESGLDAVAGKDNGRLVEIYNSIPGVIPTKRFANRTSGLSRTMSALLVWAWFDAPATDAPATDEPVTDAPVSTPAEPETTTVETLPAETTTVEPPVTAEPKGDDGPVIKISGAAMPAEKAQSPAEARAERKSIKVAARKAKKDAAKTAKAKRVADRLAAKAAKGTSAKPVAEGGGGLFGFSTTTAMRGLGKMGLTVDQVKFILADQGVTSAEPTIRTCVHKGARKVAGPEKIADLTETHKIVIQGILAKMPAPAPAAPATVPVPVPVGDVKQPEAVS